MKYKITNFDTAIKEMFRIKEDNLKLFTKLSLPDAI